MRELVAAGLDLRVISGILRESEQFKLVAEATEKLGARPQMEQAPPCAPRLPLTKKQAAVVVELQAICVESATVLGKRHRELTVNGKQLDVQGRGKAAKKEKKRAKMHNLFGGDVFSAVSGADEAEQDPGLVTARSFVLVCIAESSSLVLSSVIFGQSRRI